MNVIGRKLKIAVVGCGRISKNHFASIEKHADEMELIAVCDINDEVLDRHSKQYDVNGYPQLKDMLDSEELDIVALCTPSGVHAGQTELVARLWGSCND